MNVNNCKQNYYLDYIPPKKYASEEDIKGTMREIKKFYTDKTRGANLFQALSLPSEFVHGCRCFITAKKAKNEAAILDSKLKLLTTSVNSLYITSSIFSIFVQIGILFSYSATTLAKLMPVTGLAASTITAVIECKNIRRQIRFLGKCKKDLNLLKTDLVGKKNLFALQKYVGDSSGIKIENLAKLTNRVSSWFAEKVALELPRLLDDISQSKDLKLQKESLEKVITLITHTEIQAKKKLISQSLTLLATALLIAGFACILLAQPYLIPVALFVGNLALSLSKYILYSGTNKHVGWEFRPKECIPAWVQTIHSYLSPKGLTEEPLKQI